jgi:hypothetical protein
MSHPTTDIVGPGNKHMICIEIHTRTDGFGALPEGLESF